MRSRCAGLPRLLRWLRWRPAPDVDPPSGLAAIEQELPWSASLALGLSVNSTLFPAPLTPSQMVEGVVAPESVLSSPAGDTDVAGSSPELPNLSLEGPFDVHQDRPVSGACPRVLDGMRGCQYRMTSHDQESGGPHFSPAYGVQLHDPRLLEYVGAPESARLLSRSPEYWLHHLGHEKTLAAAHQLQHDAGLIQCPGSPAIRDVVQPDLVRGHAGRLRSGAVSGGCHAAGGAIVPGSSGGSLYGGHGIVAAA